MANPPSSSGNTTYCGLESAREIRYDSPHDRGTVHVGVVKGIVPDWKQLIPRSDHITDITPDGFIVQERLPSFGVNVRMGPEEWHERASLIPSDQHLVRWVAKKATDVGCRQSRIRLGLTS
jgi:hypothetical protein